MFVQQRFNLSGYLYIYKLCGSEFPLPFPTGVSRHFWIYKISQVWVDLQIKRTLPAQDQCTNTIY